MVCTLIEGAKWQCAKNIIRGHCLQVVNLDASYGFVNVFLWFTVVKALLVIYC